jgi:hypothetical protein
MASPFAVRSFRFQWPADLLTSWAFEMEALLLGWYILSATGSVQQLVVFAALAWFGSLLAPAFGVIADRVGHRAVLCATRVGYAAVAAGMTALTLSGALQPWHVFVAAGITGLGRPSDDVMRNALVGQTMPSGILLRALGLSRTTADTARAAGALAGAGGVALIGMGAAYVVVTAMYLAAFLLSLGVGGRPAGARGRAPALAELGRALHYVWTKPDLLGAFSLAFLFNMLAYPFVFGLLPYIAKEVYAAGQAGLGYLAAAFWLGALAGSVLVSTIRVPLRAGRVMLGAAALWFGFILVFAQTTSLVPGMALLLGMGFVQSFCVSPLAAVMLRSSDEAMRGRVMGVRMLAVWGLPVGLLAAGSLIEGLGYTATTLLYGGMGLAATWAIAWRWRQALWHRSAAANAAHASP